MILVSVVLNDNTDDEVVISWTLYMNTTLSSDDNGRDHWNMIIPLVTLLTLRLLGEPKGHVQEYITYKRFISSCLGSFFE